MSALQGISQRAGCPFRFDYFVQVLNQWMRPEYDLSFCAFLQFLRCGGKPRKMIGVIHRGIPRNLTAQDDVIPFRPPRLERCSKKPRPVIRHADGAEVSPPVQSIESRSIVMIFAVTPVDVACFQDYDIKVVVPLLRENAPARP